MKKKRHKIECAASTWIYLALLLLVLPWRWVLGAAVAGGIHEIGHICFLKILRVPILKVRICLLGTSIETAAMNEMQELICALAGPAAGLLTFLVGRKFPVLALCALVQTIYNLIPVYPSDGARALECILRILLPGHNRYKICYVLSSGCLMLMAAFSCFLMQLRTFGIMPLAAIVCLTVKGVNLKKTLQSLAEQCTIVPL